jgi:hypothetical protein
MNLGITDQLVEQDVMRERMMVLMILQRDQKTGTKYIFVLDCTVELPLLVSSPQLSLYVRHSTCISLREPSNGGATCLTACRRCQTVSKVAHNWDHTTKPLFPIVCYSASQSDMSVLSISLCHPRNGHCCYSRYPPDPPPPPSPFPGSHIIPGVQSSLCYL